MRRSPNVRGCVPDQVLATTPCAAPDRLYHGRWCADLGDGGPERGDGGGERPPAAVGWRDSGGTERVGAVSGYRCHEVGAAGDRPQGFPAGGCEVLRVDPRHSTHIPRRETLVGDPRRHLPHDSGTRRRRRPVACRRYPANEPLGRPCRPLARSGPPSPRSAHQQPWYRHQGRRKASVTGTGDLLIAVVTSYSSAGIGTTGITEVSGAWSRIGYVATIGTAAAIFVKPATQVVTPHRPSTHCATAPSPQPA